jgi:hypothetical protein
MVLSISGMHRSGTSLVTSWINQCGLVTDQGNVLSPQPSNIMGFFEDSDFMRLQEKSISRQSWFSGGWKVTSFEGLEFSKSEMQNAKEIISVRQNRLESDWGWKDPRTCLFLNEWKQLIPNIKTLIVWRSSDQVIRSLITRWSRNFSRRSFIDPYWAFKVWKAYNLSVLNYANKFPKEVVIFPLERLFSNDKKLLDHINNQLGTSLSYKPINTVFDPYLLSRNYSGYLESLSSRLGNEEIEEKLLAFSPI